LGVPGLTCPNTFLQGPPACTARKLLDRGQHCRRRRVSVSIDRTRECGRGIAVQHSSKSGSWGPLVCDCYGSVVVALRRSGCQFLRACQLLDSVQTCARQLLVFSMSVPTLRDLVQSRRELFAAQSQAELSRGDFSLPTLLQRVNASF
jgi:hypothetical protein